MLTASQDEDELLDAARLGARGIVLKAMAPRVLEDCIRTVYAGGQLLNVDGVDLSKRLAERQTVETELGTSLTPRELEIVRLVAAHLDNQEIAERLSITVGTVKIHLHHIYDKLQLRGRHELQLYLRSRQDRGSTVSLEQRRKQPGQQTPSIGPADDEGRGGAMRLDEECVGDAKTSVADAE